MTRAMLINTCWQCKFRAVGKREDRWTYVCRNVKDEGKSRAIPNAKRGIPEWCTLPIVKTVEVEA